MDGKSSKSPAEAVPASAVGVSGDVSRRQPTPPTPDPLRCMLSWAGAHAPVAAAAFDTVAGPAFDAPLPADVIVMVLRLLAPTLRVRRYGVPPHRNYVARTLREAVAWTVVPPYALELDRPLADAVDAVAAMGGATRVCVDGVTPAERRALPALLRVCRHLRIGDNHSTRDWVANLWGGPLEHLYELLEASNPAALQTVILPSDPTDAAMQPPTLERLCRMVRRGRGVLRLVSLPQVHFDAATRAALSEAAGGARIEGMSELQWERHQLEARAAGTAVLLEDETLM